jgi:hypothetical protein
MEAEIAEAQHVVSLPDPYGKCGNKFVRQEVEVNRIDAVAVTVCMICGWRKYGASRSAETRDFPVENVRGYVTDTRRKTVPTSWPTLDLNIVVRSVCAVVGCDTPIIPRNKSGLCKQCASAQKQWVASLHTTPQPFVVHPGEPGRVMRNPVKSGARDYKEASSC